MKKIFALVLSLCMVLSTFVAVSAQEQVWNEGVYVESNEVTLVNINKNFDATDAEVLYGAGITGSQVADPAGERAGMVAGGAISTGSTGYIGVKLPVSGISTGDVVEISLDVYSSADWQAGAGTTQGVMLRAGNNWAPAGDWEQVLKKETVSANTWTTLTNTFTFTKDVSGTGIWMQIRPNVVLDYFYVDNLSLTVKGPRTVVAAASTDCDADDGVIEKGASPAAINGTETADGRTYLKTHVGGGSSNFVGFRLKDADGNLYVIPEAGDTLIFSMDINPSASFTPNTGTQGFLLRQGDSSGFPGTGEQYKQLAPTTAIPANQWTTVTGSFAFTDAWKVSRGAPNKSLSLGIRTNAEMDIKIDNVSYKVVRAAEKVEAGWEVEPGWTAPDYTLDTTVSKASTSMTESNGSFIADMSTISAMNKETVNDTTCWIRVTPATPLSLDDNWTFTFDVTASGLVDTDNITSTKLRLFDNALGTTMGNTLGWVTTSSVPTTDGTYRVTLSSDNYSQAGSGSGDIVSFCICYNFAQMYGATTGSATFSNFNLVSNDSKVALSAAKTANGVDLTLANNNAEDYKFSGRLLIAEYKTVVEDEKEVKELVQFAEVAVDEEIEAGNDAVVTAEFEEDIAAGNKVHVFVWEPASFDAITMFIK